uniref:Uncharacterized protein n=2 Tax=Oryza sativa subsp. japonica TaxID=39947 RepID=A0A5S6RC52_ORYSJ|nr:Hypothetical protein [Oryza sativa Japonica Group]ABB47070.2 hypothetical protein LOC_Os10g15140 [Oryza sativa Japonica Group]
MPEETATSAGAWARRKGLPKELRRGGGRDRGQAGVEGDAATSREEMVTSVGVPVMNSSRPETEQWRQRHCCRRGCTSGGLRGKQRAGRRRGGGCDAGGGDGTAGRRSGEEGEAAGGGRRGEKRRATAGRGDTTTGRLGMRLKR